MRGMSNDCLLRIWPVLAPPITAWYSSGVATQAFCESPSGNQVDSSPLAAHGFISVMPMVFRDKIELLEPQVLKDAIKKLEQF